MSKFRFPRSIDELTEYGSTKAEKGKYFEEFLYWYYKREFNHVLQTSKYDIGVDLILCKEKRSDYRIGIQAKNFSSREIYKKDIQSMNEETELVYHLKEMRLCTTSVLNDNASQYCRNIGIEIIDRDDIIQMIDEVNRNIISNGKDYKTSLYEVRNHLMKKHNKKKPHHIISYRTIKDLLDKKPITKKELSNVHGFGDFKVQKYGEEILSVFKNQ